MFSIVTSLQAIVARVTSALLCNVYNAPQAAPLAVRDDDIDINDEDYVAVSSPNNEDATEQETTTKGAIAEHLMRHRRQTAELS
eukprot:71437-Pleurochrysis_carterae.AAC.3